MAGEKKTAEPGTELLLDEALKLSGEAVALRSRLAAVRREHAALLEQREESLSEGIDLLPGIRVKHLEIQKLPSEIAQLEQRVHSLVNEGVAKLNAENSHAASRQYMKWIACDRQRNGSVKSWLPYNRI